MSQDVARAMTAGVSAAQSVHCRALLCIPSYIVQVEEEAEKEKGNSGEPPSCSCH